MPTIPFSRNKSLLDGTSTAGIDIKTEASADLVTALAGKKPFPDRDIEVTKGSLSFEGGTDLTFKSDRGKVTFKGSANAFAALGVFADPAKVRDMLKADERFLGSIFDESAIRFFLVFNSRLKVFHYILDETTPVADQLIALKGNAPIQTGKRSGFAFYPFDGRKILVGVDERQSRLNTYLDGPFDQLPENFIEGEALREAILAVDPSAKGKIDRLGNFAGGLGRYLIHPYLLYREAGDLAVIARCVTSKAVPAADRAACFVIDNDEAQRKNPRPLALKRR